MSGERTFTVFWRSHPIKVSFQGEEPLFEVNSVFEALGMDPAIIGSLDKIGTRRYADRSIEILSAHPQGRELISFPAAQCGLLDGGNDAEA